MLPDGDDAEMNVTRVSVAIDQELAYLSIRPSVNHRSETVTSGAQLPLLFPS